jgi:uncharacterized membrane protein
LLWWGGVDVDELLILAAMIVLAVPVAAIVALVIALKASGRVRIVETRLLVAEAEIGRLTRIIQRLNPGTTPPAAEPAPLPAQSPKDAIRISDVTPEAQQEELPEAAFDKASEPARETPPIMPPAPTPTRPGFEAQLGGKWAVWVGGLALALGGIFLVRFSIAQGLLGPGIRVMLGALFALALLAGGEFLRRRSGSLVIPGLGAAHAPSVVTAAGAASLFAVTYAAYGLYGFIGPAFAFILLGVIAVATMLAAALHGPLLAPFGLLGAYASPLLVGGDTDSTWALVPYFASVAVAAYGVAHLRGWRWLALSSATGALIWSVFLLSGQPMPALMHIILQTVLAAIFLVALPYARTDERQVGLDRDANIVFAIFALAALSASEFFEGGSAAMASGTVSLILLATAIRYPAAAATAVSAIGLTVGTLLFWPLAWDSLDEPSTILPGPLTAGPQPEAFTTFATYAVLTSAAVAGASLWRLARSPSLRLQVSAAYCIAMASGPLAVMVAAYLVMWNALDVLDRGYDIPFAIAAALLGLAYVSVARMLITRGAQPETPAHLALGSAASAALAALSLGLVFWLDKGMLTVAFALSALGAAYVADRTGIRFLRYGVGALGLLVLGRLLYDPTISGGDPGSTILFNWLLWGYGVPALCFLLASRILERGGRDRVVQLAESFAIVFSALLVFFQIRHALHGGDFLMAASNHLEIGLISLTGLCFSLVMVRIDARRPDPVTRYASLAFGAFTLLAAGIGLLFAVNPLLTDERLIGGPVFNSLLLAYLMPAIAAGVLALTARATRPLFHVAAAGTLAFILHLLWMLMAVRAFFQMPRIGIWRATGEAELWTYSVVFLLTGIAFLAIGLWRDKELLRKVAAGYLLVAVFKVFLIDLSNLEGVMRALSFMALGVVLVGIGLTYQKLLGTRARNQLPPTPDPPTAKPAG